MDKKSARLLRLGIWWATTTGVPLTLVAGKGNLAKSSITILCAAAALTLIFAFWDHGWLRAPVPIGTPIRAPLLMSMAVGIMALLGWYLWPEGQAKTTVASAPQVSPLPQQPTTTTVSPPQPVSSANPTTYKPAPKRPSDRSEQERLWRIAHGEEPNGPPHRYISDPLLTEEQRLNRMSVAELQRYLADTILSLKEFEERWRYPESLSFDAPPEGPDGKQDPDQLKRYFKELEKRQNNVTELRPRKRAEAFKKEFPRVDLLGSYLHQRWPDVEGMENCVLQEKMNEGSAQGCAEYIQEVLNRSRR